MGLSGKDDILCTSGGSKIGWTEKGKLLIPKSREEEDLLSSCLDEGSLGEALRLSLSCKTQLVAVASPPASLYMGLYVFLAF